MASNKIETRTFRGTALRSMSQGDAMTIAGRALSYNTLSADLGGFKEQLQPGCFARHLATSPDVLCRREHETGFLLGRTKNGTLSLQDGPDGLDFLCRIDPTDPIAVSTHAAIRSGLIDSMSFTFAAFADGGDAFDSAVDERGQQIVRRTIKRAVLLDVAPVASPAYPHGTSVSARAADYSVAPVSDQAPIRAQIAAFNKRTATTIDRRHGLLALKYRWLSYDQIKRAVRSNYSEDTLNALNLSEITKQIRSGGSAEDPEMKFRDDEGKIWPEAASSKAEHEVSSSYHRACARTAPTMQRGIDHYAAADAHLLAATTGDPADSSAARAASKKALAMSRQEGLL